MDFRQRMYRPHNKQRVILYKPCMYHVCTDLKNPINAKVGDERSIQATKVGNIQTYFLTYGKRMNIKISNVFYVREIAR